VKYQASSSDHCHHLLINFSRKSASKPHSAISARSVSMLFVANMAIEQEVIAADIVIALLILYLQAWDVHQHSTFSRS